MKTLVTYMSKTGNTKKVAEAIYDEINGEKEIKEAKDVESLEGYDLTFAGFPIHVYGPDKKAKDFLEKQARGKKIAMFITHASPEDHEALPGYLEKFKEAAANTNMVGMFDCQGELAKGVKFLMKIQFGSENRTFALEDNSKGQPDASRLERARVFARSIIENTNSEKRELEVA
jgi:flavodoxin